MKIAKVSHHGKTRWRVNDPHGPNGKRQRRFFDSPEAAKRYVAERTADARAYGIHFASIPPNQRAGIAYQLERLRLAGWTLAAAVDFVLKHGKAPPSISLGKVAEEFLASRRAAACRPAYLQKLSAFLKRFTTARGEMPIAEITSAHIAEFVGQNGWKPATVRSYLIDLRSLFSFAVKREYLRKNPALAVDTPRLDEAAPGILTPEQARALLAACLEVAPNALPVAVLCLFGGLRRVEAEQIEWADIGPDYVEVKAHKAKTRRRRLVPISPQLRAWLEVCRAAVCPMPALSFTKNILRAAAHAGLKGNWPHNALRHSFASYHFAKHREEGQTAAIMGTSPQMLFSHYRELVRPEAAEVFFGLLPEPDAAARAVAARDALAAANYQARLAALTKGRATRAHKLAVTAAALPLLAVPSPASTDARSLEAPNRTLAPLEAAP